MRYLSKIILINSASVKYAEVNVDGNVHFIGTQGVGKSTLLRAVLFFYNANQQKLGIPTGKKIFADFYFPYSDSYIIYEVTRETGSYCVMAFKSQNRVCFRFLDTAYDKKYFIDIDGAAFSSWDKMKLNIGSAFSHTRKIDKLKNIETFCMEIVRLLVVNLKSMLYWKVSNIKTFQEPFNTFF